MWSDSFIDPCDSKMMPMRGFLFIYNMNPETIYIISVQARYDYLTLSAEQDGIGQGQVQYDPHQVPGGTAPAGTICLRQEKIKYFLAG